MRLCVTVDIETRGTRRQILPLHLRGGLLMQGASRETAGKSVISLSLFEPINWQQKMYCLYIPLMD